MFLSNEDNEARVLTFFSPSCWLVIFPKNLDTTHRSLPRLAFRQALEFEGGTPTAALEAPASCGSCGLPNVYPTLTYFDYMGVSENSVPLNPMVNDHYPY